MNRGLIKRREIRKKNRIQYIKYAKFDNYIRKVLHKLAANSSISSVAVASINSIVFDLFHQLGAEAKELMVHSGKRTLTVHDVQFAAALCFKGEVAKHAVNEGMKAVRMYADLNRGRPK